MLQQGGQIKDSFGGIGPTLDVLGSKIKSILGIGGVISAVGEAFESVGTGAKAAADGAEAAGAGLGAMAEGAILPLMRRRTPRRLPEPLT
ncbi:phage tail length tape measure family protein, partial [Pseudomonas viridiflava]|uniref:phage tail length tape measure family protein n=1 Tax=Pseudomonas viridiflava TaxID=33069 RepID=UPI001F11C34B